MVEKGENAGYQHFLLFPTMFSKAVFQHGLKKRIDLVMDLYCQLSVLVFILAHEESKKCKVHFKLYIINQVVLF